MPSSPSVCKSSSRRHFRRGWDFSPYGDWGPMLDDMSEGIEKFRRSRKQIWDYRKYAKDSSCAYSSDVSGSQETYGKYEYMLTFNRPYWKRVHQRFPRMDLGSPWLKHDIDVVSAGTGYSTYFRVLGNSKPCPENGTVMGYCASSKVASIMKRQWGDDPTNLNWIRGLAPLALTPTELDADGTTAISRTLPTNPATDIAVALSELVREGIPSLPGNTGRGNVGDEYLNAQFGWAPTIKSGSDFIQAIRDYDRNISQFLRDNGRLIRRSYDYPVIETSSVTETTGQNPGFLAPVIPTGQEVQLGTLKVSTHTIERKWFRGAFCYYVPETAFGRRIATLDKAYGLIPGPDTLYNLTPWSWLFDWFGNAGDVLKNLNAFTLNGLTMPYGYIMRDKIVTTTYKWTGNMRLDGNTFRQVTMTDKLVERTRQRRRATPYGFGLSWDGFNPFQMSILAALGISRGAR